MSLAAAISDRNYTLTNYAVDGEIVWVRYVFNSRTSISIIYVIKTIWIFTKLHSKNIRETIHNLMKYVIKIWN